MNHQSVFGADAILWMGRRGIKSPASRISKSVVSFQFVILRLVMSRFVLLTSISPVWILLVRGDAISHNITGGHWVEAEVVAVINHD